VTFLHYKWHFSVRVKFFFPIFAPHHKINSSKHPSFHSRHIFYCLIQSSDRTSPLQRRRTFPFINFHKVASFLLISCFSLYDKKQKQKLPDGVWHPHATRLVPDICLWQQPNVKKFNINYDLYIFCSLLLCKQPKTKNEETTNLLCMASKCHMISSWHLYLPEQMKNATSHISLKIFVLYFVAMQ